MLHVFLLYDDNEIILHLHARRPNKGALVQKKEEQEVKRIVINKFLKRKEL